MNHNEDEQIKIAIPMVKTPGWDKIVQDLESEGYFGPRDNSFDKIGKRSDKNIENSKDLDSSLILSTLPSDSASKMESEHGDSSTPLHSKSKKRKISSKLDENDQIHLNRVEMEENDYYHEKEHEISMEKKSIELKAIHPNIFYSPSAHRNGQKNSLSSSKAKHSNSIGNSGGTSLISFQEADWRRTLKKIQSPPKINGAIQSKEKEKEREREKEKKKAKPKEFFKQATAFEYNDVQKNAGELLTFAVEKPLTVNQAAGGGGRKYIVCDYETLWETIQSTKESERHFYEVIREKHSCHMYFDLEFLYDLNPISDGNGMIRTLLKCIQSELWAQFQLQTIISDQKPFPELVQSHFIEPVLVTVIDLESNNSTKFSRHLTIRLEDCCWEDNISIGNFILLMVDRMTKEIEARNSGIERKEEEMWAPHISTEELEEMFVMNDKERTVFFADLGVYTRNRNFRLYGSSKVGKNIPLLPKKLEEGESLPWLIQIEDEKELFMKSLICNIEESEYGTRILCFAESNKKNPFTNRKVHVPGAPKEIHYWGEMNHSPFPKVDDFVSSSLMVKGKEESGYVKSWVYFPSTNKITYNVLRNRYCFNIEREHKSNGIYVVVDLNKKVFYQKCFDPDCRLVDWRSNDCLLPPECIPQTDSPSENKKKEEDQ
eukprot:TRINITY_DN8913_c0_g1_i1.p1 TRINITY_DN8913_c0_g1~~TRINITY_DN8913_c0_g1_i1.p1  ORF type:complete len:659 (+),score=210.58 TRINITY_DN8913_c0_g1_i1:24-2000(+)